MLLPLAALVVVGGGVALLTGGGDEGMQDTPSTEQEVEEARATLTRSFRDRQQGISARWPRSWRKRDVRGEHLIESRDRCMAIKLSAPANAKEAVRLRRDTIAALRSDFERARVIPGEAGRQIGHVPTTQDVITVPVKAGHRVRILLAVGTGPERAYLTEVVLRDPDCGRTLVEGQLIIGSIRYSR